MEYCAKALAEKVAGLHIEVIDDDDYKELAEAHDPFAEDPPYDTTFEISCPVPDCLASFTVSSLGHIISTLDRSGVCLAEQQSTSEPQ